MLAVALASLPERQAGRHRLASCPQVLERLVFSCLNGALLPGGGR